MTQISRTVEPVSTRLPDNLTRENPALAVVNAPRMTAAVLHGREDVRIERVPVPDVKSGEVRVRIHAALTCGTDVKVFRRGYHARMIQPPAVFGHEFAGEIEAVGSGVNSWRVGQRVVVANSAPCGDCYYCRKNLSELCEDLLFLNGAYAQAITVPSRIVTKNMVPIPSHLAYDEAALAEPLACVVRGMEEVPVERGETVIVLGAGPIGLLFVRMCVLAGANVLAAGRRAERLALAARLGALETFDVADFADPDALVKHLKSRTEAGRGADKVIEAVGTPAAWETAIALARKAATVSLFGGCTKGAKAMLDTDRVHYDELTLKGTFHHTPHTFRRAVELIANGDVPAREFISQRAPLEALPGLLAELAHGKTRAVKIAIHPGA